MVALLAQGAAAQTVTQTLDHDRAWAQSQAAYISTLGVTQVPASAQLKTRTVALRVQAGVPPVKGDCLSPANLAYADIDDGTPTVVLCANNIQYVYRSLMPYLYSNFYDHRLMSSYGDEYRSFIYGVSVKDRGYFRGDTAGPWGICDYRLFVYFKEKGLGESMCYFVDSPSDSDFVTWATAHIDHAKLDAFRRQDAHPLGGDLAETTRLYQAVAEATLDIIVRYAVLHEIGHLQHGDLLSPPADMCAQVKMEERADDFAEQTMLQHRLISSPDDLLVARLAWAVTSARLSIATLGRSAGNETASQRVLATIDQAARILDQVRRAQPALAEQAAQAFGSMASLSALFDQVRRERHCS